MKSCKNPPDANRGHAGEAPAPRALIAIIVDEPDLQALMVHHLRHAGYQCRSERDGLAALTRITETPPDLILLDLMLPGMSGTNLLAELRREQSTRFIPVIVFTARSQESDELVGFALGADDYLSKPFSVDVLLARVRAVLRRSRPQAPDKSLLSIGPFTLSRDRNEVTVAEEPILLTRTEFRLLREVLAADGRVVRRDRLMEQVFGTTDPMDRRIDVHMTNLRRKLGSSAAWIQTIRGVGYACRDPVISTLEHMRQSTG